MKKDVGYISLKKHKEIVLSDKNLKVKLPEGCTGVMYIFKNQKSARKWDGKNTNLRKVWFEE